MVTSNRVKFVASLGQKKFRESEGLFVAEGPKVVEEFLMADYRLVDFFATELHLFGREFNNSTTIVNEQSLKKMSNLVTPNKCLAVFEIPEPAPIKPEGFTLALDSVRDPGNLGTIIRLCDWFGITNLVCSEDTVDAYNPKVVQSAMGSLARIQVHYTDVHEFLRSVPHAKFSTAMDGTNIYETELPREMVLVLGNEANGISHNVLKMCDSTLSIPRFGNTQATESLNVANAAAICLSEYRRKNP